MNQNGTPAPVLTAWRTWVERSGSTFEGGQMDIVRLPEGRLFGRIVSVVVDGDDLVVTTDGTTCMPIDFFDLRLTGEKYPFLPENGSDPCEFRFRVELSAQMMITPPQMSSAGCCGFVYVPERVAADTGDTGDNMYVTLTPAGVDPVFRIPGSEEDIDE